MITVLHCPGFRFSAKVSESEVFLSADVFGCCNERQTVWQPQHLKLCQQEHLFVVCSCPQHLCGNLSYGSFLHLRKHSTGLSHFHSYSKPPRFGIICQPENIQICKRYCHSWEKTTTHLWTTTGTTYWRKGQVFQQRLTSCFICNHITKPFLFSFQLNLNAVFINSGRQERNFL